MTGITIRNLVKQWDETRAVDDVSFDVQHGTMTVLLGPSGCGKSTILRMIAGLEDATSGRVFIGDNDVTHQDPSRRGVSMVFQSYALFPHLNVRENILFGLKVRKVPANEQQERLMNAARMVGLEHLLDRKPAHLSGGQRQRVALSRTIVANQPVCLMDEPLSNLDAKLRAEMRDEICTLQRKLGLTMVYVTHDQTEAMSMADQIVLLNAGVVEQTGTPTDLYETPRTAFAARFLGMPPMNIVPVNELAEADASMTEGLPAAGWSIGIRPEDIKISDNGLNMRILAADYMGAETVFKLQYGKAALQARVPGRPLAKPGEHIHITWDRRDMHLFDEAGVRQPAGTATTGTPEGN